MAPKRDNDDDPAAISDREKLALERSALFEDARRRGDDWAAFHLFHTQLFELDGITAHIARRVEVGARLFEKLDREFAQSKRAGDTGKHHALAEVDAALQTQIDNVAQSARNDVVALGELLLRRATETDAKVAALASIIGDEPNAEINSKGSGIRATIAQFKLWRTVAIVAIGAFIAGGGAIGGVLHAIGH